MLYNGIRIFTIPDGYAVLADWKRAAFPAIWHGTLCKDWVLNEASPADGKVLLNELNRTAFVNVRTYAAIQRTSALWNPQEPAMRTREG